MSAKPLSLLLLALSLLAAALPAAATAAASPPGALRFFADPGPPPTSGPDPLVGGCVARSFGAAVGTQLCSAAPGRGLNGAYAIAVAPGGDRVYVAATFSNAVAVLARDPATGALSQPDDPDTVPDEGCIAEGGRGGCIPGRGLDEPIAVAVSPDGGTVYAASRDGDAVAALKVAPGGSLTQAGLDDVTTDGDDACVSEAGAGGCVAGRGLDHAAGVAVAPDGASVYAAGRASDALVLLRRTPAGGLAQPAGPAGCVHDPSGGAPAPPGGCATGRGLNGAFGVALDPSGTHAYVAARLSDSVAAFDRDGADGSLTQLDGAAGCVARALDGCTRADGGLNGATAIAFDPAGRNAYVAAYAGDSVLALSRDSGGGALTPLRCFSDGAEADRCSEAPALDYANSVAVSPDGGTVYVGARNRSAVGIFRRTGDGTLRIEPPPPGRTWSESCLSWRGHTWVGDQDLSAGDHSDHRCARGLGLYYPYGVAVSPDGRDLYVAALKADAVTQVRRLPAGDGWAPDDTAPGTQAAGPEGSVRSPDASFVIAPLEQPAVLECRVDDGPWRRCRNPARATGLADGPHAFEARALDPAGNIDPTPERVEWTVATRPRARTGGIAGVRRRAPLLSATVDAGGRVATARFEWGRTTAYGALTAPVAVAGGRAEATLPALAPGRVHHFRAIAESASGAATGGDRALAVLRVPAARGGGAGDAWVEPPAGPVTLGAARRRGIPLALGCARGCVARVSLVVGGRVLAARTRTLRRGARTPLRLRATTRAAQARLRVDLRAGRTARRRAALSLPLPLVR